MARAKSFDIEKAQQQAMQLFWQKGYAATSIEDLAQTLHLSRSSLYDTFGDKHTLFLTVLRLYSHQVVRRIERLLNESSSPIAVLQTLFDELIILVGTKKGDLGCFMVNSIAELVPYDSDVAEIAAAYSHTLQRLFTDALTRAAEQDLVTAEQTPTHLAAYVFNAIQGMRILIKSGATREQLQVISDITLHTLQ